MSDCIPTSSTKPTAPADTGTADLPHTPASDFGNPTCLGSKFVLNVKQGQRVNLTLNLVDRTGTVIDLTPISGKIITTSSSSSSGGPLMYTARFMAEERPDSHMLTMDVPAVVTDYAKGIVEVQLDRAQTNRPGIFFAQVAIFDTDGNLMQSTPYWLSVEHTVQTESNGPISIAEVRLILRDVCPDQNFLLDDVEFSDTEIAFCIIRPIDEFNETYQPKTSYTASTFPWRSHWLNAASGYLMRMAANSYARNYLDYGVSGAQINLQNKVKIYTELSSQLLAEWKEFIKSSKLEQNIENAWGTQRSSYVRRWF
ncbi:MAG: hypothetical protein D0530_04875 [Methylococcales bacterium]|nr:MAG: hypothetical protein D0530_04875 [Methylococcales bacterium]